MFIFTMIQHTKAGDVVAPSLTFDHTDEWKAKYHHEMDYAISNPDFKGLSVLVVDDQLQKVFYDNWIRSEVEE